MKSEIRVTVLIPTFNRKEALEKTLRAYANQSLRPEYYEVLVIDDGSTDGTFEFLTAIESQLPYELKFYRQKNSGPGMARNIGFALARGFMVFITGDDIIPHEDILMQHFMSHVQTMELNYCYLGFTSWSREVPVTPVMHHITDVSYLQFGYPTITHGSQVNYGYFYTSNISVKRTFFRDKELFKTEFVHAAFEDIELGYRLEKEHGMKLFYNENARAEHIHPITVESFCRRQYKAGEMAVVMHQMHPELNIITEEHREYPASRLIREIRLAEIAGESLLKSDYASMPYTDVPEPILQELYGLYDFLFNRYRIKGEIDYCEKSGYTTMITVESPTERDRIAAQWLSEGETRCGEGKYPAALALFLAASDLSITHRSTALSNAGVCYWQMNRPEDAYHVIREAVELNSSNEDALLNLGELCDRMPEKRIEIVPLIQRYVGKNPHRTSLFQHFLSSGNQHGGNL